MMICPRCLLELAEEQTVCPHCHLLLTGFSPSLLAAMRQQAYATQEPRHNKLLLAGIGAIAVGLVLFFVCHSVRCVVSGSLCLTCGATTLFVSRCGKQWDTLSFMQKALIVPGVVIGLVFCFWLLAAGAILRFLVHFLPARTGHKL